MGGARHCCSAFVRRRIAIKEIKCADIIAVKPDLVITEKGVSDLAQHYLQKANISVLRRVRKTDNNRVARASGATIVHRTSEIQEKDLGLGAGLFNIEKIGDEYYAWIVDCERADVRRRRARSSCAARRRTCSTRSSATSATR